MHYFIYIVTVGVLSLGVVFSLDLLVGRTGLFSMCQAAFFGVGAYATALLLTRAHLNFVLAVLIGAALAGLVSVLVSVPALRVRSDYLVIATLGLQFVFVNVATNVPALGGTDGLQGLPKAFGISGQYGLLIEEIVVVSIIGLIYYLLVRSSVGRTLALVRLDEVAASALGRSVRLTKVVVFAIAAAMAGMVGGFYASFLGYISPQYFTVDLSLTYLVMLVVGGLGTLWGCVLGVAIITALPRVLEFAGTGPLISTLANVIYGGILVVVLAVQPAGIWGAMRGRKESLFDV